MVTAPEKEVALLRAALLYQEAPTRSRTGVLERDYFTPVDHLLGGNIEQQPQIFIGRQSLPRTSEPLV